MVVLEGGGMITIGNNQYLQPDYLSPLPTTLDAKKSPLAMLAQTCSQIGADSSNVKSLISVDKSKNKTESAVAKSPSAAAKPETKQSTAQEVKLAFKPYEANVLTKKSAEERPSSKASSVNDGSSANASARAPSREKTDSPINVHSNVEVNGKATPGQECKSTSPAGSSQRGQSPIIRSGMEVLQGHPKDLPLGSAYKPGYGINPLTGGLCCPPGLEQHANPAFRPPFAGAFSHHHAAMLAAAAGYPPTSTAPGPYVSYARVKTPTGGEALVPVCKDPYCTGCQYSAHNQQMLMGAPCPAGCTQCEHQKYGLAMAAMQSSLPPGHPYAQLGRPYICNWIAGETYCGKRFSSSEELLQHLRTHTASLADPAAAAAALAQSQSALLSPLGPLFSPSALHRAYPTPPLSPLSAGRYHPYSKPGALSSYPPFNPALGPYYSPYALYGQRLGAAAVHP
ncbi:zinc finger protein Noc [Phlebotomus argentipes]|uniref:zinc finger protein Noc n=1 Tax=Phlebotomus argentipes TaxID=94469 RepID=UPI002892F2D3|nr:zinc finger protein Noc [Phlebotomus argentipes]